MLKQFTFIAGTVLLLSCGSSSTKSLSASMPDSDDEGTEFEVSMKANPSTGLRWFWVNKGEAAADSIGRKFVAGEQKPMMVGKGGTDVWTFKTKSSGTKSLKFYLVRPRNRSEVVDSFVYNFDVK